MQELRTNIDAGGPRRRVIARLPVAERTLELEGISTPVLEGGDGPPVVLLHGPGEFAWRWLRVIPDLVETHRVIAPDLPGHGASLVRRGQLTETRVLEWLDALIDHTTAAPPVLAGHILGGAIAARFAIRRPERIRQLVLIDSLGLGPFRPAPRFALALFAFMARPGENAYERLMTQCEHDSEALANELGDDWNAVREYAIDRARDPRAKAGVRALMRHVGVPVIPAEQLAGIAVPTSLIWGRHDRALRVSIAEAASERYGWPLEVLEDTADDAPFERPLALLAALRRAFDASAVPTVTKGAVR